MTVLPSSKTSRTAPALHSSVKCRAMIRKGILALAILVVGVVPAQANDGHGAATATSVLSVASSTISMAMPRMVFTLTPELFVAGRLLRVPALRGRWGRYTYVPQWAPAQYVCYRTTGSR